MSSKSIDLFHKELMAFLNSQPEIIDFVCPVEWKKLGLYDYRSIIKNPMSISLINKKFNSNKYSSIDEIIDDVKLIWDNCRTYNRENSVRVMLENSEKSEHS